MCNTRATSAGSSFTRWMRLIALAAVAALHVAVGVDTVVPPFRDGDGRVLLASVDASVDGVVLTAPWYFGTTASEAAATFCSRIVAAIPQWLSQHSECVVAVEGSLLERVGSFAMQSRGVGAALFSDGEKARRGALVTLDFAVEHLSARASEEYGNMAQLLSFAQRLGVLAEGFVAHSAEGHHHADDGARPDKCASWYALYARDELLALDAWFVPSTVPLPAALDILPQLRHRDDMPQLLNAMKLTGEGRRKCDCLAYTSTLAYTRCACCSQASK